MKTLAEMGTDEIEQSIAQLERHLALYQREQATLPQAIFQSNMFEINRKLSDLLQEKKKRQGF